MNALYRDYSFLASAYLLEPCHERFVRGEGYGLARDRLPRSISLPIARCADLYVTLMITLLSMHISKFVSFHPVHRSLPCRNR